MIQSLSVDKCHLRWQWWWQAGPARRRPPTAASCSTDTSQLIQLSSATARPVARGKESPAVTVQARPASQARPGQAFAKVSFLKGDTGRLGPETLHSQPVSLFLSSGHLRSSPCLSLLNEHYQPYHFLLPGHIKPPDWLCVEFSGKFTHLLYRRYQCNAAIHINLLGGRGGAVLLGFI